jgi:predicted RNA-binding protein with RPS1 domain
MGVVRRHDRDLPRHHRRRLEKSDAVQAPDRPGRRTARWIYGGVGVGGLDGLLHVTDISWKRVNHPTEVLGVGQQLKVQVIRFNRETQRISLGMKQLEADPWEGVEAKYPIDARFTGRVTNITDYGAFVELEPGVEGLVRRACG